MKVKIVQPGQRFRKPRETGEEIVDVEPGNFKHGDSIFSTFGASSGLVIAAHNSDRRLGLLGHFNSFTGGRNGLSDAVIYETALYTLLDLGATEETEVWLGGVSPSRVGEIDVAEENRQYARDRLGIYLERFNIPDTVVRIDWNPDGTYISARLACDTGRLLVRQTFDLP